MKRILSLPALAAFALLGASCSQQVRPVKKTARPPVYVGKVEQVYPSHNYVLIALAGNVYEPGTVLISQSPGREENRRVANLIVTEERMGRARIPADIRSGAVEAGDLVFLYRNLAAPESSGKKDNPDPDNPEPGTDEDGKEVEPDTITGEYSDMPHVLSFLGRSYDQVFNILMQDDKIASLMAPFKSAYENKANDQLEGMVGTLRVNAARLVSPEAY